MEITLRRFQKVCDWVYFDQTWHTCCHDDRMNPIYLQNQMSWSWTNFQIHWYTYYTLHCPCLEISFYAPGLKGLPGASSVWIVCPSVCLSVRYSVPLINKVQYIKFGWSYSNQTLNVSSPKGCSHFSDITCPWGVGRGKNVGLRDFCHSLTLLPPGASVFHKHMSSFHMNTPKKPKHVNVKCCKNTNLRCYNTNVFPKIRDKN